MFSTLSNSIHRLHHTGTESKYNSKCKKLERTIFEQEFAQNELVSGLHIKIREIAMNFGRVIPGPV